MYTDKQITALSKKLQDIVPAGLSSYFYASNGLEANSIAVKIAHLYHAYCGDTNRNKVISTQELCYCASNVINVKGAYCKKCDYNKQSDTCNRECLEALRQTIMDNDPSTIACLIMESLIYTDEGYLEPPKAYLQKVKAMCYEFGIVFILDETKIGIVKDGFASMADYFGVTPDILTLSKSIATDIEPLGVCTVKQGIVDSLQEENLNFLKKDR